MSGSGEDCCGGSGSGPGDRPPDRLTARILVGVVIKRVRITYPAPLVPQYLGCADMDTGCCGSGADAGSGGDA